MEEGGAVSVSAEHPEQTVQIPVHHPEGGRGGGGERVGLHPRQHVELRVGGAAGKARHQHVAGDGVGVLPQGVEIGQGVVLRRVGEGIVVRDVGEGLVHHHDDVHVLPQARPAPFIPRCRLRPVETLGPVHRPGGELVAEAVGESQLVKDGGDVVGVGHGKGVVQAVGGVDRENQPHQHGEAGHRPQQAPQPAPQSLHREGAAAHKEPQGGQCQRKQHYHSDGGHRELDVIGPHGAAHLFEQGEVPGEHRLVPDLDLDAVGDGQDADPQVHQGGGEEHVSEQAGEHQQQHPHRQAVEDDQQGLAAKDGQHAPQGVGLAPQGQQGDGPRQQHGGEKRAPQGQAEFRKTVMELQGRTVLSGWISSHTEYLHYKGFPEKSKAPTERRVPLSRFCGMIRLEKERMTWTQRPPAGSSPAAGRRKG